jgi:N-acetylglucosaminyldiphosphoundecaprenol N-acetyl-beta-D-mannosaminyltransferase
MADPPLTAVATPARPTPPAPARPLPPAAARAIREKLAGRDGARPLPAPQRPASAGRVALMGVELDALDEQEVVEHILAAEWAGFGGVVLTPNVDLLRQGHSGAAARHLQTAEVVVADGMPLLWAARIAGTPLPGRVAGSNLIWSLSAAAGAQGLTVFLLGGNPGSADQAARSLTHAYPDLVIAGTHCPPYGYERDPQALAAIRQALQYAQPDIVFVGLPFPKGSDLVEQLKPHLPSGWFVNVGVSFSFLSGEIRRAPYWAQRIGAEWLWRLASEPKRLSTRYLVHGLPFAARLLAWAVATRLRRG